MARDIETCWKNMEMGGNCVQKQKNIGVVKKTHFVIPSKNERDNIWKYESWLVDPIIHWTTRITGLVIKGMQPPAHRTCHIKISSVGKPSTNGYQWDIVHCRLEYQRVSRPIGSILSLEHQKSC
jgi:hypothetical protein